MEIIRVGWIIIPCVVAVFRYLHKPCCVVTQNYTLEGQSRCFIRGSCGLQLDKTHPLNPHGPHLPVSFCIYLSLFWNGDGTERCRSYPARRILFSLKRIYGWSCRALKFGPVGNEGLFVVVKSFRAQSQ